MSRSSRSFFRRNWPTFTVASSVLLFITVLGGTFFLRGRAMMEEELKSRLQTTAAVAADQFEAASIEAIHGPEDMDTPDFLEVVTQLSEIRSRIPDVQFVYLMRRTDDPMILEFVADADSLADDAELDTNGNGQVENDEEASYAGDAYDISEIPALQGPAFEGPAVDEEITYDQWGALISGYAPVRDPEGNTVAVLGIDMSADQFLHLSERIFSPVAFLLVMLAGVIIAVFVFWHVLQRRLEARQQIEQERTSLLQLTLHRLGTPLTIFKWSIEMLDECERNKDCSTENIRNHIGQMREGIGHMEQIITALLKADKVTGNRLQYRPENASVSDVIQTVHIALQSQLHQRNQSMHIALDGDMHLPLDRELITGVLQEIVQNAMFFSPVGAVIELRARRHMGHVQVDVTDPGCGIPSADVPRMFQKFARASNASVYRPDGNGLGLFIVKEILERAGGKIWLSSREGKGTTVSFTLPVS